MMSKVKQTDIDQLIVLVGGRDNIATRQPLHYPPALRA